jgi:IPT/TIG domain
MTQISRAIVLAIIVHGVAGCDGSSDVSRSPIPTTPTPTPPATPMSVTSIAPDSGPTWRDTQVEIKGTGFQPGARVRFGRVNASSVGVINGETIWARSPILDAETVDVVVTNLGGQTATLARAFTFVPIPLPTLTMSASAVAPGGDLTVSWATEAPGPDDYIALYSIGASSEEPSIWHVHTVGATSGTAALKAPNQPGRYEFRYLPDDGHVDVAKSATVTVR